MKRSWKRWKNKLVGLLMALVLAATMLLTPFVPPVSVSAEPGKTNKFITFALPYLKKGASMVLGAAAARAKNDDVAWVLEKTQRLLRGKEINMLSDIKKLCQEMNAKLDALNATILESTSYIEGMIQELAQMSVLGNYNDSLKELTEIDTNYQWVIGQFQALLQALQKADPENDSSMKAVENAYNNLISLYEVGEGIHTHMNKTFNFTDDYVKIARILGTHSAAAPIDFDVDFADEAYWGDKNGTASIIEQYYAAIKFTDAFDHEYVRDLTTEYNHLAGFVANFLEAYSIYIVYYSQYMYARFDDDRSLQTEINTLWSGYDTACYTLMRALSQMMYVYDGRLKGAMREYDVQNTITFKDAKDSIKAKDYVSFSDSTYDIYTSNKSKTDKQVVVSQVRPMHSNTAYAFRQVTGSQKTILMNDLCYLAFTSPSLGVFGPPFEYTGFTCDYYNLAKISSSAPSGWKCISGSGAVSDLINTTAYLSSQVNGSFPTYLGLHGVKNLPKIDSTNYSAMTSTYYWVANNDYIDAEHDIKMDFVTISPLYANQEVSTRRLDMDDDYDGLKNKETTVIYEGKPNVAFDLPKTEGATYQYRSAQLGDKTREDKTLGGGYNVLSGGDAVTLRVKPNQGKYVTDLKLIDKKTNAALYTYISPEDHLDRKDCGIYPDKEGYFNFVINVPFRDSSVEIAYGDDPTESYRVTLTESEQVISDITKDRDGGVLLFESYSGESSRIADAGETVSVRVLPYSGFACTGIEVRDADGHTYEARKDEETERAGVAGFSFTMPAKDVTVKAIYGDSYTVELYTDDASPVKLSFVNEEGQNVSQHTVVNAVPGEKYYVKVSTDSAHVISRVEVGNLTSHTQVECDQTGFGISFTMPEGDVLVRGYAEDVNYGTYIASIVNKDDANAKFVDESGLALNVASLQLTEGAKARILFREYGCQYELSAADGSGGAVALTPDADADGVYLLTMPKANVTVMAGKAASASHDYVNGICKRCGSYEPAVKNGNGEYEIANAGNFLWFAALVNDEHEHAVFEERDTAAKAALVRDIDLENRTFTNMGKFTTGNHSDTENRYIGTFDGRGHTISNFHADGSYNHWGMFGTAQKAVKNLTVKGTIDVTADEVDEDTSLGLVAFAAAGMDLLDVTSELIVKDNGKAVEAVGGIAGVVVASAKIERCVFKGSITGSGTLNSAGGLIGDLGTGCAVKDCANLGTVTVSHGFASGLAAVVEMKDNEFLNCYNYGTITGTGDAVSDALFANVLVPFADSPDVMPKNTMGNCFYLEGSAVSGNFGEAKTAGKFASGEVCFLLTGGVTDGTQVWYQNIDNGKPSDAYPVLDKTHGTVYGLPDGERYSNSEGGVTPTATPAAEPTDEPTVTPTPTPAPGEPTPLPPPVGDGIGTYEELVAFAASVNAGANSADVYLEDNISVPDEAVWTEGIGTAENPYGGSFDGRGFAIIGLNVDCAENGGLFGYIGKDGVVKNVYVIDCDFEKSAPYAGGIAAVNEGTIDHCTSGINLQGKTRIKGRNISEYNSFVNGTESGGIAAVNKGTITGSRSGAVVVGAHCGGIAAINEGRIYGSANNGAVGKDSKSCKRSGGLAGENTGTIESSYNSGKVNGSVAAEKGAAIGVNSGEVTEVFYADINSLSAMGSASASSAGGAKLVKNSEMLTEAFVKMLNDVTDETVNWTQTKYRDTYFNQGYPTILQVIG